MTNLDYTKGEMAAIIAPLIGVDDSSDIINAVVVAAVKDDNAACGYMVRAMGNNISSSFTASMLIETGIGLMMGSGTDPVRKDHND